MPEHSTVAPGASDASGAALTTLRGAGVDVNVAGVKLHGFGQDAVEHRLGRWAGVFGWRLRRYGVGGWGRRRRWCQRDLSLGHGDGSVRGRGLLLVDTRAAFRFGFRLALALYVRLLCIQ